MERVGEFLCRAFSALGASWAANLGLRPRLVYYAPSARCDVVGLGSKRPAISQVEEEVPTPTASNWSGRGEFYFAPSALWDFGLLA